MAALVAPAVAAGAVAVVRLDVQRRCLRLRLSDAVRPPRRRLRRRQRQRRRAALQVALAVPKPAGARPAPPRVCPPRRRLDEGSPSLRQSALESYGIEVVDVRLRRLNHPVAVREAIFDRIRSERAKKVAEYQSEGERVASEIRSRTERELTEMKAES